MKWNANKCSQHRTKVSVGGGHEQMVVDDPDTLHLHHWLRLFGFFKCILRYTEKLVEWETLETPPENQTKGFMYTRERQKQVGTDEGERDREGILSQAGRRETPEKT